MRQHHLWSIGMRTIVFAWALVSSSALGFDARDVGRDERGVKLTAYDVLARPGDQVVLRAKVEHDDPLGVHIDLHDVTVLFELDGAPVGSAVSAHDGYADLPLTTPLAFGEHAFRARVESGTAAQGKLVLIAAAKPIFVTDIDNTISDLPDWLVPVTPIEHNGILAGSSDALHELAQSYTIVYLTARDDMLYNHTRRWLDYWSFPSGVLITNDWGLDAFDQYGFKRESLAALQARFSALAAGAGDRAHDARAYLDSGMRAYLIGRRLVEGAVTVRAWAEILEREP
jgi:hypothetical protein